MLESIHAARRAVAGHAVRLGFIAVASVLSGLAQVAVLVIIVQSGLALSRGAADVTVTVGPLSIPRAPVTEILIAGGLLVGLLAMTAYTTSRQAARMGAEVLARERMNLLRSFYRAAPRAQLGDGAGVFHEVTSTHTVHVAVIALNVAYALVAGLNLGVLLVSALILSTVVAAAVLGGVLVLFFVGRPLARRRRHSAREWTEASLRLAESLNETYASAREVRVYGAMDAVERRIGDRVETASRAYYGVYFFARFGPIFFQYAGFGILLLTLGLLSQGSSDSLPILGSVLLLVLRSLTYVQSVQVSLSTLIASIPYLARLDDEQERYRESAMPVGGRPLGRVESLAVAHAFYEYLEGRPALHGLDFHVGRGEAVGVVGPSGSGKSSLVQVLLRLIDLDKGRVLVNGQEASTFSLESWYQHIALVSQDPVLIAGSIAENIRFFRLHLTQEEIEQSARAAGVHDAVMRLPQGYDTPLAHAGRGLSGGQRQRICIARALVGRPEVLVLDEPTSALDPVSAATVVETLRALREEVTMVIVSHQDEVVQFCDRIVEVREGRVSTVRTVGDVRGPAE
jgi:ATP-binding cassette subfamily B protein